MTDIVIAITVVEAVSIAEPPNLVILCLYHSHLMSTLIGGVWRLRHKHTLCAADTAVYLYMISIE